MLNEVIHGDALQVLRSLPTHSVDAICSDPPAGVAFMGKDWDKDKGGRDKWIDWLADIMSEALRVIKPGGHAFVWALPRTSHWTALSLEYGGWQIRDACVHLFGSGMPKSHDISKAIDRLNGAEREVIGMDEAYKRRNPSGMTGMLRLGGLHSLSDLEIAARNGEKTPNGECAKKVLKRVERERVTAGTITAPATPDAQQWEGWGSGLKPSHELWWLARSPLSEKSIAENVLKWGTGALNIDASRIAGEAWHRSTPWIDDIRGNNYNAGLGKKLPCEPRSSHKQGRWPANLLLSHTLFCVPLGEKKVKGAGWKDSDNSRRFTAMFEGGWKDRQGDHYTDADGTETVQAWDCAPDCPVALLDMQSGHRKSGGKAGKQYLSHSNYWGHKGAMTESISDEGGASRYFQTFHETPDVPFIYTSKASRSERNKGCEALPEKEAGCYGEFAGDGRGRQTEHTPMTNNHPTVKPISLMRYLVTMITPPGGIVLDMFAGSGTTGVACIESGFNYILVEQDSDYCEIARARLAYATQNAYTCKDNMTI